MTELHSLPATELLALYKTRDLSPVEVMRAVLAHAGRCEPRLNALYALDADGALAQARGSEARWRDGAPQGALDGVPITIKENIATKGVPVPLGTAATLLAPASADAPPAARAREAGAIIFAKTTMPDYGMLSSGLSSFHKLARNPFDPAKSPGGSSSGAAAAAAAGYGPLHLGTDIGGSVRLPAGWCGLFALKPSLGRIPIDPPTIGRVAGPMTRTVADGALMMSVLSAPDPRDSMSLPPADIAWGDLDRDVKGLRIGLLLEAGCGTPASAATRAAVEAAARLFEAAGAHVEPLSPFLTQAMLDGVDRFWRIRALVDMAALPAERRAKVLPFIRAWAEGAQGLDAPAGFAAFAAIHATRAATVAATQPFDFVLSPTSPDVSFPAEWPSPSNDPVRALDHIGFTYAFNMSEQPAASINCGYDADGMPIGLQIAGRRFDDLGVLQMARAFERMRGPQRPWPEA